MMVIKMEYGTGRRMNISEKNVVNNNVVNNSVILKPNKNEIKGGEYIRRNNNGFQRSRREEEEKGSHGEGHKDEISDESKNKIHMKIDGFIDLVDNMDVEEKRFAVKKMTEELKYIDVEDEAEGDDQD